jgi:acyl-CoA synthetase (AMP-forming)/AMP-acid ligase II
MLATVLRQRVEAAPGAIALMAPGGLTLDYRGLMHQVESLVQDLNRSGVGRGDRVAIVLPNGPEMALAFLAAASGAVAAPLNPACRPAEFEFYLTDLRPKALIVPHGTESAAARVAAALGAAVLELSSFDRDDVLTLIRVHTGQISQSGLTEGFEAALLLHTSGTTARPKQVRLTQSNLCASAANTGASLSLCADDRCLNVMPLFHVHGLVGALLSSLVAGSSVVCTTGFDAFRFFTWLDDFAPTWYTAVPAMHQALLSQAPMHSSVIARRPLRFIRSCSAALAPRLMHEL